MEEAPRAGPARAGTAEIKMVPSDPSSSLFTDRHARPEPGKRPSRGALSLCSPHRLLTGTDRCSGAHPLISSLEASTSKRPFTSPHRLLSFESHRSGIVAPGLSLQCISEPGLRSVRLQATLLNAHSLLC